MKIFHILSNLRLSHPSLEKPSLDCENLKNYRPVANLKFLAKTIERAFSSQIQEYLVLSNLRGKMQSAYRQGHSIETALLRVYNGSVQMYRK